MRRTAALLLWILAVGFCGLGEAFYDVLWNFELEDVSFNVRAGHTPDACVAFSSDGKLLAVGTLKGRLLVFESASGRLIFERKIPEAMVKKVAFSSDGRVLYFGEQGPEGRVCAVRVKDGSTVWCLSTAEDVKRGRPPSKEDVFGIYRLPGIYRLKVFPSGELLVLSVHSWFDEKKGKWRRLSRLYRLDPEGRVLWRYPSSGPAGTTLIYADADEAGRFVAVVSLLPSEYEKDLTKEAPPQSFILLSGASGRPVFFYPLKPLRPYFDYVAAWESVAVSPDGTLAILGTSDGRLFVFRTDPPGLHGVLSLATPILFGDLPVSASLGFGVVGRSRRAYVVSGESTLSYGSPFWADKPAGPHPSARTFFVVDLKKAEVVWRFPSPLRLQGVAVDEKETVAAVCTSAFRASLNLFKQFGVLIFDLNEKELLGYLPTEGTCFFHLAVSRDGRLLAFVETPWKDELERIRGKYRVWVVRLR